MRQNLHMSFCAQVCSYIMCVYSSAYRDAHQIIDVYVIYPQNTKIKRYRFCSRLSFLKMTKISHIPHVCL